MSVIPPFIYYEVVLLLRVGLIQREKGTKGDEVHPCGVKWGLMGEKVCCVILKMGFWGGEGLIQM